MKHATRPHMSPEANKIAANELRQLIPLSALSEQQFQKLCSEIFIEEAESGTTLFQQGDPATEFVYLLSGSISLQAGGVEMDSVVGGTNVARFALAHQNPRKVAAVARDKIRFVRINANLVTPVSEIRPGSSSYVVDDTDDSKDNDWMSSLLHSPIFHRLPPANLQTLLRNAEEKQVKAGDVICRQDEPGDYFYIIKSGQCALGRKPTPSAKEIKLVTLKSPDTFGEDALISEAPHSLTARMESDGQLLRLSKANFLRLIRDPVISRISAPEALEATREGAVWLDVRLPDQYQQSHPDGPSINIPFFSLRMMLPTLDRNKRYIAVCDTGKVSEAAAYYLLKFKFKVQVLQDGIGALPEGTLSGSADQGATENRHQAVESDRPLPRDKEPVEPRHDSRIAIDVPTAHAVAESKPLESIVNRLIGEKAKVEAELQEARQTIHRLEASLAASRPRKDADPKPPTVASGTTDSNEASPREASEGSLDDIKARYAEALFEKESARQEIDSLEKQVADFRALVEEFLAQGALLESEHTAALHSEMEMVREQAGSELMALQAMLQEAEAENARLRACVEAAPKPSTALTESAAELALPHEDLSEETATTQPKALSAIVTPVALAIVLSALILGGLFGLPAGRDLVRSWVGAETSAAGRSEN